MPELESEVVITDSEGKRLPDKETEKLLKALQAGVFYLPQASWLKARLSE